MGIKNCGECLFCGIDPSLDPCNECGKENSKFISKKCASCKCYLCSKSNCYCLKCEYLRCLGCNKNQEEKILEKYIIKVYIDNGIVYEYDVDSPDSVREHASAIIKDGYRHNNGKNVFMHFPPHRILKVKCEALIPTKYPDRISGT